MGAPCRYPVTAPEFRAHTHRRAPVAAPAPEKGPQYLKFPGKNEGLVVLGEKPLVAETPESLLDDDTTPIEKFYIRNNGQIPEETKNPDAWKITIDGEVNNKIEITLGELKSKYKAVTRRMVLECGGNGRAAFSPPARGNQWTNGGAGCAEWTGVPLADLLKKAGLKPSAKYTAHYAADLHLSGDAGKPTISRGVRLENREISWSASATCVRHWSVSGRPILGRRSPGLGGQYCKPNDRLRHRGPLSHFLCRCCGQYCHLARRQLGGLLADRCNGSAKAVRN